MPFKTLSNEAEKTDEEDDGDEPNVSTYHCYIYSVTYSHRSKWWQIHMLYC